ncbi:chitosanase [Streptomyces justiciae]|uniref:Chitosanase n=1 Tax=Streptomyces justiciae TaxID=2780140 RepID=A0ABU3LPF3_9ACTN|nr:chitosanase [Streptomyces justiciae]MDT7841116.1 chitosanase [Streptomyces justiciae]
MRRIGVPLLAAVPVAIAAGIFFLSPSDSSEEPDTTSQSAVGEDGEAAKNRAEEKRSADDKAIAALPPGLAAPAKKELAQQIVASAENSTLDWRTAYAYIEDIGDGQGYTAGIIGFCTGTHDLLTLVERYTKDHPDNGLARYLPALREVDGSDSHEGLDPGFTEAWKAEAKVEAFREAQDAERDRVYFDPAVRLAKLDGLGTLGQFIYYDAMVFHGPGTNATSFYGLRESAMKKADLPSEGGSEEAYLGAFLDVRKAAMRTRKADIDTTRVDTAQRRFLREGKLGLETPLTWAVYGETYKVP